MSRFRLMLDVSGRTTRTQQFIRWLHGRLTGVAADRAVDVEAVLAYAHARRVEGIADAAAIVEGLVANYPDAPNLTAVAEALRDFERREREASPPPGTDFTQ